MPSEIPVLVRLDLCTHSPGVPFRFGPDRGHHLLLYYTCQTAHEPLSNRKNLELLQCCARDSLDWLGPTYLNLTAHELIEMRHGKSGRTDFIRPEASL
jgi:hypothetical protein